MPSDPKKPMRFSRGIMARALPLLYPIFVPKKSSVKRSGRRAFSIFSKIFGIRPVDNMYGIFEAIGIFSSELRVSVAR